MMNNEEFYHSIESLKKDIVTQVSDTVGKPIIKEFQNVSDYLKRSNEDFQRRYDRRLDIIETEQRIIKAKLWPWWIIACFFVVVVLALVVAIIVIIYNS